MQVHLVIVAMDIAITAWKSDPLHPLQHYHAVVHVLQHNAPGIRYVLSSHFIVPLKLINCSLSAIQSLHFVLPPLDMVVHVIAHLLSMVLSIKLLLIPSHLCNHTQ